MGQFQAADRAQQEKAFKEEEAAKRGSGDDDHNSSAVDEFHESAGGQAVHVHTVLRVCAAAVVVAAAGAVRVRAVQQLHLEKQRRRTKGSFFLLRSLVGWKRKKERKKEGRKERKKERKNFCALVGFISSVRTACGAANAGWKTHPRTQREKSRKERKEGKKKEATTDQFASGSRRRRCCRCATRCCRW